MRQLVIGCGEVGSAVAALLGADSCDLGKPAPCDKYDVVHICFPYSERFCEAVASYRQQFSPSLVVIHSTVPVGTSRKCDAVHSPVRGKHPHLLESLRVFVKYFGGELAEEAAALFPQCKVHCVSQQETTEMLKLWDTTIYGVNIALEKTIYEACQQMGVDFDVVYRHAGETYNAGYAAMGNPEFCKYVLKHFDGPIGGHCVTNNAKLLGGWPQQIIESAGVQCES